MNPPNPGVWTGWGQIIAAGIALIGVFVAQYVTARENRKAREREAAEKRAHRWDEFQLKALVELQDAVSELARLPRKTVTTAILTPLKNIESANIFIKINDDLDAAMFRAMNLAMRAADDELTLMVIDLVTIAHKASKVDHDEYNGVYHDRLTTKGTEIIGRIGNMVKALKPSDSVLPRRKAGRVIVRLADLTFGAFGFVRGPIGAPEPGHATAPQSGVVDGPDEPLTADTNGASRSGPPPGT